LKNTKKTLIDIEEIIKIWGKKYRIFNKYLNKITLEEEISVWKNFYKKLLEIKIRIPLVENKIKIANKIERLIKVCQDQ
jgi:hypothetical protein